MPLEASARSVPFPWMPAGGKVLLALSAILIASVIPFEHWPALGLLLVTVFAGLSLTDVSIGYLIRRVTLLIPMMLAFGISVPLTQSKAEAGWSWTIALWLRCLVSFLSGLWLIRVLPFTELLPALIRWKVPKVLVAMLAFMYRYIFLLWEELASLRNARDARDFGQSWRQRWVMNAQMIGLLLLRAMERAERSHQAMLARGWDGTVRFLQEAKEP